MNLLAEKTGLICGVLNKMSIAWSIAESFLHNGAKIILTYQKPEFLEKISELVAHENCTALLCDVSDQESINNLRDEVQKKHPQINFLVHAIAFSDKNELKGNYYETSRENFLNSMNISCFSLTALSAAFHPLMNEGGSILTLTYYGAEKFIPNYNVMGVCKAALECNVKYLAMDLGPKNIRVNAISAGTIRTMASYGISNFKGLNSYSGKNCPLQRNVKPDEVARAALFLASDLSSGITGEVMHVDCGYNIVGIPKENEENN